VSSAVCISSPAMLATRGWSDDVRETHRMMSSTCGFMLATSAAVKAACISELGLVHVSMAISVAK
jgi:hypothetical protein